MWHFADKDLLENWGFAMFPAICSIPQAKLRSEHGELSSNTQQNIEIPRYRDTGSWNEQELEGLDEHLHAVPWQEL